MEVPILSGGRLLGSIHMVYSSEQLLADLQEAWRGTLNLTVSLLAIGIIGIFLLSSYFVTPIIKITRRVRRFSSGDL